MYAETSNKGDKSKARIHPSITPTEHHCSPISLCFSRTASRRVVKLQQATGTTVRVLVTGARHEGVGVTSLRLGITGRLDTVVAETLAGVLQSVNVVSFRVRKRPRHCGSSTYPAYLYFPSWQNATQLATVMLLLLVMAAARARPLVPGSVRQPLAAYVPTFWVIVTGS